LCSVNTRITENCSYQ